MTTGDNFFVVQFAEAKQPEYKEKKKEGYMEYGDRNDYPLYLVELFNKSAKHNAIVRNKVHYICGNGWTGNEQFIEKPNRSENLNDLTRKISMDLELFGGAYIEVIWGLNQVAEMWHIDYTKIRTNKDNTQFWYKENWKDAREKTEFVYPAFNPKVQEGKQIIYLKEYRPNIGVYSLPVYFGALNYIESDIEVSKHVLGNAKTGFSASKLITLPDGQPSREEQNEIHKKFKNTYTGSDGVKYMLSFVNDASRKPIVDDLGQSDLTKEDFGRVDELIQTNIFSGHQVTTPSIFGIAVAGSLGSRSEMRDGYEIFKTTYVSGKQQFLESFMNTMAGYFGYSEEMRIIPTEAIGMELGESTLLQIMSKDELREKVGLQKLEEKAESTQQDVIDAINSLSPLVANKVLNTLTPNELRALINLQPKEGGQDLQPEINPVVMAEQYSLFYEFGEDKSKFEVWKQKSYFEDMELFADVTQLQSDVLDLISKDKRITPEVIADTLKEDIGVIKRIITALEKRGFIKSTETTLGKGIDSNIQIERQLTEPLRDIVEKIKPKTTEFLIRYSYEWKQGFNNSDKPSSREFCKYLLSANKMYSRSEIEQMSARLGYSVWDRRGGWWTKPNGEHSPSCRHQWVSNVVTRK
jgi:DNA-binding MarR family transcriptional regulator/phage portal protein BeeE